MKSQKYYLEIIYMSSLYNSLYTVCLNKVNVIVNHKVNVLVANRVVDRIAIV